MTNDEHLAQLKKGVENWNEWRIASDIIRANLSGANLSSANLSGVNFSGVNLSSANLSYAYLIHANLSSANLSSANLSYAYLIRAYLSSANLRGANLSYANLSGADLSNADLSSANLSYANLRGAGLNNADLSSANLRGTDLSDADLSGANFSNTLLIASQLLRSNLTAATLTGACIQDWNINNVTNLVDVICDYVYLKAEYSELSDRRPSDPDRIFAPGEFSKLFQKALETVDLIFGDGIDWKAFFQSFQELRSQYDDDDLSIQAIEKKSGGAFVIRLEVPSEADKGAIESRVKELYECNLQRLEAQYTAQLQAKDGELTTYKTWLDCERERSTDLIGIIKTMADKEATNVNLHFNAPVTGVAGHVAGNQNVYVSPEKQSLAEAAAEIQTLLKQLEQTNPTATEAEQKAFVTAAIPVTLRQRAVGALQAFGKTAIAEFLENPYVNVAIAIVEGWRDAEA